MAILTVEETWRGRTGKRGRDKYTFKREFVVVTDDKTDTAADVLAAGGNLPAQDAAYPGFSNILAGSFSAKHIGDSPTAWKVTVSYSPEDPEDDDDFGGADPNDPFDDPIKISGGSVFFMKALQFDLDGTAISSSAGEPFEAIEVEDARPILRLTKNEAAAPYAKQRTYTKAINSDAFWGAGPKTLMCQSIDYSNASHTHPDTGVVTKYWVVTYEFEYKVDKWNPLQLLDQGSYELIPGVNGGAPTRWSHRNDGPDGDGSLTNADALLDGGGRVIPPAPGPRVGVKLDFKVYKETGFGGLGLGEAT